MFPLIVGEQLCDDQQRILSKCSSLSPAAEHHAWAGDSCGLSRKSKVHLPSLCLSVCVRVCGVFSSYFVELSNISDF